MARMLAREHSIRFDCIEAHCCDNYWTPKGHVMRRRIQRKRENRQWKKEFGIN